MATLTQSLTNWNNSAKRQKVIEHENEEIQEFEAAY